MDQLRQPMPEGAGANLRTLHSAECRLLASRSEIDQQGDRRGAALLAEGAQLCRAAIIVLQSIADGAPSLNPGVGGLAYWKLALQLAAHDMAENHKRGRRIQIPASQLIAIDRRFKAAITTIQQAIKMTPSRSPACRVLCIALAAFDDLRSRFDDYCFAQVGPQVDREVDLAVISIFYGETTEQREELFSKHCGLKRASTAAPAKIPSRQPLKRRLIR